MEYTHLHKNISKAKMQSTKKSELSFLFITLSFAFISAVVLYSLTINFFFWLVILITAFLILHKISFHLWVPTFSGILGLLLFGYVDQTLEIYRSLVEDASGNINQVFWGSFNVFWFSVFVWSCSRLLSEKYSEFETLSNNWMIDYEIKTEQISEHKESLKKISGHKEYIKEVSEHKESIKKISEEYIKKIISEHKEYIALILFPRFLGLLPIGGFITGLYRVLFSNTTSEGSSIIKVSGFGLRWLIILVILFLCLNILFFYRDLIVDSRIIKIIKSIFTKSNSKKSSGHSKGLFDDWAENIIAGFSLLWFSALSIPIVAKISGIFSIGVFAIFLTFIVFDILIFYFNYLDLKSKIKDGIINYNLEKKVFRSFLISVLIHTILSIAYLLYAPAFYWAKYLGAISVVALCLSSFTVIFSAIYYWGYSIDTDKIPILKYLPGTKIPSVSIILILALLASQQNWNDNHQIRYLKTNSQYENQSASGVEENFLTWFNSRPDLDDFSKDGEYPVYVVSAQGGGIYAAYHAAMTLAGLHDGSNGIFSSHTFAISGVSGGSLGASVYSSLVKGTSAISASVHGDSIPGLSCEELTLCAQEVLEKDFLSPLFSLALFPDLLQRFIPFKINDWDRARGLELALEDSWDQMIAAKSLSENSSNPLSQEYYKFWEPGGQAPALVLNTTVVETGKRLVFSPFTISSTVPETMLDFEIEQSNFSLSTVAVLSARFPIFTPAGWFEYFHTDTDSGIRKTYKSRLVDGGYFDNSGVATARDMISVLETSSVIDELKEQTGLTPKFINIAIVDAPKPQKAVDASAQGINEIFSPFRAVLGVRSSRAMSIVEQAKHDLNSSASDDADTHFRAIYLEKKLKEGVSLPLGWLLSGTSRQAIERQLPSQNPLPEKACTLQIEKNKSLDSVFHNYCVSKLIFAELKI